MILFTSETLKNDWMSVEQTKRLLTFHHEKKQRQGNKYRAYNKIKYWNSFSGKSQMGNHRAYTHDRWNVYFIY